MAIIARDGVDAFYEGAIANATVRANVAAGGLFTVEDMRGYKVEVREPIQVDYHGYRVTSVPAPAGGAAVLSILKIMEGYEVGVEEEVNVTMHRLNEAMRFAFGARTVMGDPRYLRDLDEFEREITSDRYANEVRGKIIDRRTLGFGEYNPGEWEVPEAVRLLFSSSSLSIDFAELQNWTDCVLASMEPPISSLLIPLALLSPLLRLSTSTLGRPSWFLKRESSSTTKCSV